MSRNEPRRQAMMTGEEHVYYYPINYEENQAVFNLEAATGLLARTDPEKPDTWTVTTEDGYQCTLAYKKGTERLYVHGASHLVKKIRQEHAFQQRSGLRGLCACGGFKPGCESGCTAPCTPSHRRIRPVTVML